MMVVSAHVYPEVERERKRERETETDRARERVDRRTERQTAGFVFEFAICVSSYPNLKQKYGF